MNFVFDASALIAFLRDEEGAACVEGLLANQPANCLVHAVNLCEVFYYFFRFEGEATAHASVGDLRSLGLAVREDMDEGFWQQAGRYKVAAKLPLGDAFAVTRAERCAAELVSSDRGDFEPLARNGLRRIRFIR